MSKKGNIERALKKQNKRLLNLRIETPKFNTTSIVEHSKRRPLPLEFISAEDQILRW